MIRKSRCGILLLTLVVIIKVTCALATVDNTTNGDHVVPGATDGHHGAVDGDSHGDTGADHGGSHGNDSHSSEDGHGNGSHDGHHGEHHGIHVVTIDFEYVKQPLIVSLFMIAVVICKIGFHHANFLSNWMPESCVLIILGTMVGLILHVTKADLSDFYYIHPATFFLFLLPPCILEASYSLWDEVFFQNIGTILIYAVVGTIINCFLIAPALYGLAVCGAMGAINISLIQCFVFASLIVAVDPVAVLAIFQEVGVNSVLYFLVFGESLLNDAVTVVLYKTITTLSAMPGAIPPSEIFLGFAAFFTVSLGGLSIGIIFGLISGLITRFTQHIRVVEPLAIFSLAYGAYCMAELFHFSGIISMIGCGLVQRQYAFHNISANSTTTIKYFCKMLSGACDSIIFMFLGISLVRDDHNWNWGFVIFTAILCLAVRFLATFGLTFIVNRAYRSRIIDLHEQFIMAYGGLRGAVAFCLVAMLGEDVISKDLQNMFRTTTLFIIIFTVFVQGMTIKPFVKWLKITSGSAKALSMAQEINNQLTDHILVFMEEVSGHLGHSTIKEKIYELDQHYLKPVLQRDPFTREEDIMELYQNILLAQHYENLNGGEGSASSSMALLPTYNLVRGSTEEKEQRPQIRPSFHNSAHLLENAARAIIAQQRMLNNRNSMYTRDPTGADDFSARHYQTVPAPGDKSRPSVKRLFSVREDDDDVEKRAEPRQRHKSNKSIISRLGSMRQDDDAFVTEPTVKDLKRWLIKPVNSDIYQRRHDKNLKNDEEVDLVSRLHDNTMRHERYKRSASSYSAAVTPFNGLSRTTSVDRTPGFSDSKSPDALSEGVQKRLRHNTDNPQGNAKYVPRYRQKQPGNRYRHTVNENTLNANEDRLGDANISSPPVAADMPVILIDQASREHLPQSPLTSPSAHLASVPENNDVEKGGVTSLRSRFFCEPAEPSESIELLSAQERQNGSESRRGHFARQNADDRNPSV